MQRELGIMGVCTPILKSTNASIIEKEWIYAGLAVGGRCPLPYIEYYHLGGPSKKSL